ncbi:MAG TPA: tetratricopeptide repeat protein [Candidatus Acidoferrum sp.]|nr:tetratricopeptide repeat protein [Candidatus Acidoferrum sp.]
MSQEIEREGSPTISDSLALCQASAKTLVRRGLSDFVATANGDKCCSRGLAFWEWGQYKEAVECFARGLQCQPNHAALQFYLGLAYYQGIGVSGRDCARAVGWWQRAAEHGSAQAQNNLGRAHEYGEGVEVDLDKAVYWYQRATTQNHPTAQYNLGVMYELGRGVAQDFRRAAVWYRQAAEQGYAPAQYNLAGMLRSGLGVAQDLTRAAWWYGRAAQQHHASAQFNLAVMYERGEGVPPDFSGAAFWYQKAAENGDESARNALADVLKELRRSSASS